MTLRFNQGASLTRRLCLSFAAASALLWASSASAQQELTAMEKIRASGTLKVALYKDNAPYSDGNAANMTGVDAEVARALAKKMGLSVSFLPFDAGENMNDDLRNMVWKGHYMGYGPADVMLHVPVDQYMINQNKQAMIFNAYSREQQVVMFDSVKHASVSRPEDLQGLRIAVEQDAGAASVMLGYGGGAYRNQVMLFRTGALAAKAVLAGEADVAYISRAQAESALFKNKQPMGWVVSNFSMPGALPNGWPLGMAVKKDSRDLIDALDQAMAELRSSGELLQIFKSQGLTLVAP